jgi:hypothetical protein
MTTHQIDLANHYLTLVYQARGLVVQTTEHPGTILSVRPSKREMWMEGPRLPFEAARHESPFYILLQTP